MRVLLALLALLMPGVAGAGQVGLHVSGEHLKGPTANQAETWLRAHDHAVVHQALPTDAIKILADCFVLDDVRCSRSVIDARATTDSLLSIRVEVTSKKARDIRLTIDWFVKGHNPVSARRTCERCTEDVLRSTLDAMLVDLAKIVPGFTGRLQVTSNPSGLTVLIDNATVGTTPIERDLPIGRHRVRLARDGHMGDESTVIVLAGETTEVTPPLPKQAPHARPVVVTRHSRVAPGILVGLGLAGLGAGATLYFTSEEPTGMNRTYRDTKTLGLGVAGGGAALALTGVIIILATSGSSAPTVAMVPGGGATVGWLGRF